MEKHRLFDTHAHYDHPLFEGRGPQIVKRLFDEGIVNGIVIPAISYESNFNRDMFPADAFPEVFFAAGLHPKCATNEACWSNAKKEEFLSLLRSPRTVAVKTGLDFCKKKMTPGQKDHQISFFRLLISFANTEKLPLVLHIREAASEALDVLNVEKLNVEAAAHCFTYDLKTAEKMMQAGVSRFGIGGMVTREGMEHLRECVKALPLTSILLETDAPFVKPEGYGEALNTSETLMDVVNLISSLKGIPVPKVIETVQKNALEFYNLEGRGRFSVS